jgi:peptidoglycan/LPS O-acetylase OafA/YrhL
MYWVSPVILLALNRSFRLGVLVWSLFFVAAVAIPFALAYTYHLSANALPGVPGAHLAGRPHQGNIFELIENKPYARMAPYLAGILLAYFLTVRNRSYTQRQTLKPHWHALGWTVCFALLFLILYCVTGFQARLLHDHAMTQFEDALWLALSRPLWACVLAWITFTALTGYGGWAADVLASPIWLPISRLTFCAYLVHPIVLNTFFNTLKHPLYYQDGVAVYFFLGNTIVSYMAAAVIALLVETPFAQLENVGWLRPRS